jgi:intracellular septation protein A
MSEVMAATALPPGREILRVAGPRIARDVLCPLAAFYLGYKLIGLGAGIAFATVVGLTVAALARRREGRPGLIAAIAVVFIVARGVAGLVGGSATAYLAGDVVMDTLLASAFLGSLRFAKEPLAAAFAEEIFPVPDDARDHDGFMTTFRFLTLVWGLFFVVRGCVRVVVLATGTVDVYVAVSAGSELLLLALMGWSARYSIRAYREAFEAEAAGDAVAPPAVI